MRQSRVPAAFIRGGTSNAVVFDRRHLPADEAVRERLFIAALGSPDPYGRQLDGMGGGISSLSKVCIVGPPSRPDADVDYTFGQVAVDRPRIDWSSNCGNMSSAIGPFAVDEGLVEAAGPEAAVVIHNTNTTKLIRARFPVEDGRAAVEGDTAIPGVSGCGAPVDLEFLEPGGAGTGTLLPTGNVLDTLEVEGVGSVPASLVDAANAFVFVDADDVGITGVEMPAALDTSPEVMDRLERIRAAAAVAMGIAATPAEASERFPSAPKIGIAAPPRPAETLSGEAIDPAAGDLTARMVSMGNVHRAPPPHRGARIRGRGRDRGHGGGPRGGRAAGCGPRRAHPPHQPFRGDRGRRRGAADRGRRRLARRARLGAPDPSGASSTASSTCRRAGCRNSRRFPSGPPPEPAGGSSPSPRPVAADGEPEGQLPDMPIGAARPTPADT